MRTQCCHSVMVYLRTQCCDSVMVCSRRTRSRHEASGIACIPVPDNIIFKSYSYTPANPPMPNTNVDTLALMELDEGDNDKWD
jgi:hypothetical protein